MSKGITEKQEERAAAPSWQPPADGAPSFERQDEQSFPRILGMIGAMLVIFGGMALFMNLSERMTRVPTGWATFAVALGLAGLLFHAAFDRDIQFRRLYRFFSYLALGVGILLWALTTRVTGPMFPLGVLLVCLALLFLLAFHRNETDPKIRDISEKVLGGAGGLMALVGLIGGMIKAEFLIPYGLFLAFLGLIYLAAFVATRGVSDDLGYRAGLGLGLVGLLVFLIALGRSALPPLFYYWKWLANRPADYWMPQGMLLVVMGLLYMVTAALICSERPLAVLTRRELGAFFYSPMAYLVLLGFSFFCWFNFLGFISNLAESQLDPRGPMPINEPIVRDYFFTLLPVIALIFIVPVLTMRLLSEEQRTGTLEVLLTAPVEETTIVLSKFFAALIMFLTLWIPFGLYLAAIPLAGGSPFDYYPLLAFFLVLTVTGAGFVSMGVFFSSLTRNQVASGVLTFVGMCALTYAYLDKFRVGPDSTWGIFLNHMSYLDVWYNALMGKVQPRALLFFLSMPILLLFMTVKVLEARKWR
jgi:hypothetical protein